MLRGSVGARDVRIDRATTGLSRARSLPHPRPCRYKVSGSGPRQVSTAAGRFRKQLEALMLKLNKCDPGYIRCIKPNARKAKQEFDSRMCMEQLRYAGV